MMKRRALFLLGFVFIVSVMLLLSSCNHVPPSETTGKSSGEEDTTGGNQVEWIPDVTKPWNFTPVASRENSGSDIEVTLEQSVFAEMPETLVYTMTNKTGKPFYCLMSVYCEKQYSAYEVGNRGPSAGDMSLWVRVPFYHYDSSAGWVEAARPSIDWKLTVSAYIEDDFTFTPGKYRLVTFADDGPHYAYFEITG